MTDTQCVLCDRVGVIITEHHLIPKTTHKRNKNKYSKERLKQTVDTCKECHKQVHAVLTEKECANIYNTVEKLKEHPRIARFIEWIKDKDPQMRVKVRKSK